MKLSELSCCPFCEIGDEYYEKIRTYGTIRTYSKYDGKFETPSNSEMYDNLQTEKGTGRVYCGHCNRYIGNYITDKLSKSAERQ